MSPHFHITIKTTLPCELSCRHNYSNFVHQLSTASLENVLMAQLHASTSVFLRVPLIILFTTTFFKAHSGSTTAFMTASSPEAIETVMASCAGTMAVVIPAYGLTENNQDTAYTSLQTVLYLKAVLSMARRTASVRSFLHAMVVQLAKMRIVRQKFGNRYAATLGFWFLKVPLERLLILDSRWSLCESHL